MNGANRKGVSLYIDGILFIAGTSPKGPCVFMCKPSVREAWSANFVGTGSTKVTHMSVTLSPVRDSPYLAVGLSDKSISVWTYNSALVGGQAKANEPLKRWLFPLCRLDAAAALNQAEPTSATFNMEDDSESSKRKFILIMLGSSKLLKLS
jgi:hypothetical protein